LAAGILGIKVFSKFMADLSTNRFVIHLSLTLAVLRLCDSAARYV
jgi:hypothetical protein